MLPKAPKGESAHKFDVYVSVKNKNKVYVYSGFGSCPNTLTLHLLTLHLHILAVYHPPSYMHEENMDLIEFIYLSTKMDL